MENIDSDILKENMNEMSFHAIRKRRQVIINMVDYNDCSKILCGK